ncbi:MAG: peptidoglycan DD-metalloendopeptidase family protein, partial [Deltaproteobacteria bacterium]|nr:peptidoglycan DD-metalloendopeptidase family protein [Deltaproteobacteria bacterium]
SLGSTPAAADKEADAQLDEIRRAIEESRDRLLRFDRNEFGLIDALEATDESISLLTKQVSRTRKAKREADEELAAVVVEERELVKQMGKTQRAMSGRAVALYKTGDVGPLSLLFSAADLKELLARSQILRMLLKRDHELLQRFLTQRSALEKTKVHHEEVVETQTALAEALRSQLGDLRDQRRAKGLALKEMHKDRRRERQVLVDLEAAARAMEETLRALRDAPVYRRREQPLQRNFAGLKGSLPLPVDAPVLRGFGQIIDEEFRTKTFHKGVDFGGEAGVPVQAVADGDVRFAGWFRGYGKIVIVDHSEQYFTISGHLESIEVEVGDEVAGGEVLGTVGETGSLSGPRLYFEIREGSEALDPAPWFAR